MPTASSRKSGHAEELPGGHSFRRAVRVIIQNDDIWGYALAADPQAVVAVQETLRWVVAPLVRPSLEPFQACPFQPNLQQAAWKAWMVLMQLLLPCQSLLVVSSLQLHSEPL